NEAFAAAMGKPISEIVGRIEEYLDPDDENADTIRASDVIVLKDRRTIKSERWLNFADGRRRYMQMVKFPFEDADGNLIGLVGVGRDVTEIKLAEEGMLQAKQLAEEAARA